MHFSEREVPLIYRVIERMEPFRVTFGEQGARLSSGVFADFDPPLTEGYAVPLRVRGTVFGAMLVGQQEGQAAFRRGD